MHTEVLLNPFYQADYVIEDDGQNHSVFTKIDDEDSKSNVNKMDAVEDILLDDFSLGDSSSEGGEDEPKRSSSAVSADSSSSMNIRRTKGK